MNAREIFEIAEHALQRGGRVLLEVTAVLMLSYLLFFVGSLLVAAIQHLPRRYGHDPTNDVRSDSDTDSVVGRS